VIQHCICFKTKDKICIKYGVFVVVNYKVDVLYRFLLTETRNIFK